MARILVIDDEVSIREVICERTRQMGHEAEAAQTLEQGRAMASSEAFDLVFLDVRLPDGDGLKSIAEMKTFPSAPEVIIITGVADEDGAKLAVDAGAWDYLQKPLGVAEITLQIQRTLDYRERSGGGVLDGFDIDRSRIIGHSSEISRCLHQAANCAASAANVLICGETGTGKELFARTIHENSSRRASPFVVVDCAALPEHLVESVLFGHVKGAFTGAEQSREGLVIQADGGTLFLDEVGELPLQLQKSFLRVLQEHRFRPVGGRTEKTSRFRLISATNRDLDAMAAQGRFRKDLLYRLQTTVVHLPPLRERKGDIEPLMLSCLHRICDRNGMETKGFVPEFLEVLDRYDWPGNVRELINALEHAVISGNASPTLYPTYLPSALRIRFIQKSVKEKKGSHGVDVVDPLDWAFGRMNEDMKPFGESRDETLRRFEKAYVSRLMQQAGGDLEAAMAISGLSRTRLYDLLKKHGVSRK